MTTHQPTLHEIMQFLAAQREYAQAEAQHSDYAKAQRGERSVRMIDAITTILERYAQMEILVHKLADTFRVNGSKLEAIARAAGVVSQHWNDFVAIGKMFGFDKNDKRPPTH